MDVNMDLEIMVLNECKNGLGESKAISQPMKMDSTSCSYNSASHGLDKII